jgi:hypothetical protein
MTASRLVPIVFVSLFLVVVLGWLAIDLFWVLGECERRCQAESLGGLDRAHSIGWGITRCHCEDGGTTVYALSWFSETMRGGLDGSQDAN